MTCGPIGGVSREEIALLGGMSQDRAPVEELACLEIAAYPLQNSVKSRSQ
jgi:hypothetical protein